MIWKLSIILAAALNAFWVAYAKNHVSKVNPVYYSFLLRLFSLIILVIPFLFHMKDTGPSNFYFFTLISGLFASMAISTLLTGVKKDFYASYTFFNMSPLFVLLLSVFILREPFHIFIIFSILLCIGGIFLFYKGKHFSSWGLLSCLFIVCTAFFAKLALNIGNIFQFIFFQKVAETIFLFIIFQITRRITPLSPEATNRLNLKSTRLPALLTGSISAVATLFFFIGFKNLTLIVAEIIFKSSIIFGLIYSYFYLKEKERIIYKLLGSFLILVGVLLVSII